MQVTATATDRYPSRGPNAIPPFARPDPTVWGWRNGPLDGQALIRHSACGYTIQTGLFHPAEIAELAAAARAVAERSDLVDDPRLVREKSGNDVRSIFDIHELDATVSRYVHDQRLVGRAEQILGTPVYIHQCRVNYMPGFTGQGFYWHSDFETWHAEDGMPAPRAVSASIALSDNKPFNGSLMVMPGSHRTFVSCSGTTPEDNFRESLREQTIGIPSVEAIRRLAAECGIEQFTGPAGSVLFFDSNVMHGSGNNITPYPRSNVFIVFNSIENALVAPFAAPRPRPNFLAHRDVHPIGSAKSH